METSAGRASLAEQARAAALAVVGAFTAPETTSTSLAGQPTAPSAVHPSAADAAPAPSLSEKSATPAAASGSPTGASTPCSTPPSAATVSDTAPAAAEAAVLRAPAAAETPVDTAYSAQPVVENITHDKKSDLVREMDEEWAKRCLIRLTLPAGTMATKVCLAELLFAAAQRLQGKGGRVA
jgi:hypothetical protein